MLLIENDLFVDGEKKKQNGEIDDNNFNFDHLSFNIMANNKLHAPGDIISCDRGKNSQASE